MKIITVSVKSIYGKPTIYPVCETARAFARLLGQKTFTEQNIKDIKAIGVQINVTSQDPVKL